MSRNNYKKVLESTSVDTFIQQIRKNAQNM